MNFYVIWLSFASLCLLPDQMAARVREKPSDHGDHSLGVLDPNANDMGYSPLGEETTLRLS